MPSQLPKRLQTLLACPLCQSPVAADETGAAVLCEGCEASYRVVDGIPVMLPAQTTTQEEAQSS